MAKIIYTYTEIKSKIEQYCSYQERSYEEVIQKINQYNLIPAAQDKLMHELIQNNFLNEARYVELYVRSKINQKRWGIQRIKQNLYQKKIAKWLVTKYINSIDEIQYLDNLNYWIQYKSDRLKAENQYIKKKKLVHFLQSKGYELDLIITTLETIKIL